MPLYPLGSLYQEYPTRPQDNIHPLPHPYPPPPQHDMRPLPHPYPLGSRLDMHPPVHPYPLVPRHSKRRRVHPYSARPRQDMHFPLANQSGAPQAPLFDVLPARNPGLASRPYYLPGPSRRLEVPGDCVPTSAGNNFPGPSERLEHPDDRIPMPIGHKEPNSHPQHSRRRSSVNTLQRSSNNTPQTFVAPSQDIVVHSPTAGPSLLNFEWRNESGMEAGESSKRLDPKFPGMGDTPHDSAVNTPDGETWWSDRMEEDPMEEDPMEGDRMEEDRMQDNVEDVGPSRPARQVATLRPNFEGKKDDAEPAKPFRRLAPIPLNFNAKFGPGTESRKHPEPQTSPTATPPKTADRLSKHPIINPASPTEAEDRYWGTLRGGSSPKSTPTFTQTEDYPTLRDLVMASWPDYDFSGAWDGTTRIGRIERGLARRRFDEEGVGASVIGKRRDTVGEASEGKGHAAHGGEGDVEDAKTPVTRKEPSVRGAGWDGMQRMQRSR